MEEIKPFEMVQIKPREQLFSFVAALELAGLDANLSIPPRYFDLPLIAVITDKKGVPIWEPTQFLADISLRSRSRTGDTVRTYAESILPWLAFLFLNRVLLIDVTEETFGIYRSYIVNQVTSGGRRKYSSATANQRMAVVTSFHSWGQRTGRMRSPFGEYLLVDQRIGHSTAWRSNRLRRAMPLMPNVIQRMPQALSHDEIRQICLITPSPYRLMLRWCVVTGMRRSEVCNLRISDLPSQNQIDNASDGLVRISILRKGAREQTVHVPVALVEETNWYCLMERGSPQVDFENYVFLNKRNFPISRASLTKRFRKSADQIGCSATLHHLRHTFAVHVMSLLEHSNAQGEELNSLKTLQVLLGHSNSVTTEIYLQAMETSSASVITALDYLYGASL
ncbi:tyrosine-type recombinase/integrase [Herminiimonas arsenitoxidans]|uniref:tyrosine-type recombinase/integrase n=1 Tax=Herminiimonas arsenitoxidans TaxID=1809410 RepID=UPI0009FA5B90|nr:tyrosine-type recombinase/integrase [Herminiimonas arsenitoxidans]